MATLKIEGYSCYPLLMIMGLIPHSCRFCFIGVEARPRAVLRSDSTRSEREEGEEGEEGKERKERKEGSLYSCFAYAFVCMCVLVSFVSFYAHKNKKN